MAPSSSCNLVVMEPTQSFRYTTASRPEPRFPGRLEGVAGPQIQRSEDHGARAPRLGMRCGSPTGDPHVRSFVAGKGKISV
jgi:hypothetical protein